MKRVEPAYFAEFRCIASACRHNCCIGWEIDIDPDTLARYRRVPGPLGERLRAGIVRTGETASFRLTPEERCPFLNGENLCDLILGLGEDALCDICRLHPRFYNRLGNREEAGLGLACEAAARLILTREAPFALRTAEEDDEALTAAEASLLAARDALLDIARDRRRPVWAREDAVLAAVGAALPPRETWRGLLEGLERMDPAWDAALARLDGPEAPGEVPETMEEQLLCAFLYRHLLGAADPADFAARAAFAVLGTRVVRDLSQDAEAFLDMARAYSAEVEYSEENTAALLDALAG